MIALLLLVLAADADPAATVLRSLEDAGRRLHTMQAEFQETRVNLILDERTETRGRVCLEVPGRLRWDYVKPQPSVMMVKDGRFARYIPQSKQVFRGAARGEADLLVGFGPGTADLGRKYTVTLLPEETVGGVATWVLDLVPKNPGLFSGIRLWVDKARSIPVQTRLTEPTGDHTTIRFQGVVVNKVLPRDAFLLDLPKDVTEVQ